MTATLPAPAEAAPDTPSEAGRQRRVRRPGRAAYLALLGLLVLAGVVIRFCSRGDLWLDEALTVNISSLPPRQLIAALKIDGSPPLYYLLLHVWIELFGSGTHVVRALSGIFSTLALVPAWFIGRRLGGPGAGGQRLAVAAVVLLADAPFALRFGSETRMYSLILLETCLAGVALLRALERPSVGRLVPVTLAVLALAFTHYWSFFLLATCAVGLLIARRWRVLLAFVVAGVLFTPQIPTLLYQLQHTGTPWAPPVQARAVIDTLLAWGGPSYHAWALPLGFVMLVLALLGAVTVRDADGRLLVDVRRATAGVSALGLSFGTVVVAVTAIILAGTGFVERYTAIAVPAWVLLIALGLVRIGGRTALVLLVAVASVGFWTGTSDALQPRTQAGQIASTIEADTQAGDLVVYCPDQLAPAIHRELAPGRVEVSYGDDLGPSRVDWVDYAQRNRTLQPAIEADDYNAQAGPTHSIALVVADGYRTLEGQCPALAGDLGFLRPGSQQVLGRDTSQGESAAVVIYPGSAQVTEEPDGSYAMQLPTAGS